MNSAHQVPAAAAGDSKKQFKVARGDTKLAAAAAEPEHSEAELKLAKVNALQDLEKHDPKVRPHARLVAGRPHTLIA